MSNCCGIQACDWFKGQFNADVENTDDGIKMTLSPKDASKGKALQDFVQSAKNFCKAFCKDC